MDRKRGCVPMLSRHSNSVLATRAGGASMNPIDPVSGSSFPSKSRRNAIATTNLQAAPTLPDPASSDYRNRRVGRVDFWLCAQPIAPARSRNSVGTAVRLRELCNPRPMTSRWIWFVPSKICITLASRMKRSTGKSRV